MCVLALQAMRYVTHDVTDQESQGDVPSPEYFELVGLPAGATRGGHQEHPLVLEHCWCLPSHVDKQLGVAAGHMSVVRRERADMHHSVVL